MGVPGAPAIHGATWTRFSLPLLGPAVAKFEGPTNPGVDIAGQPGAPILASRDGRVMLVSNALPAYGTMIVLKHVDEFITVYAHLGRTLVQESDEVSLGQQIAELGSSGSDHGALHFEIRKMGVPVNPELYLQGPAR
jgi:lipoprotein NlpD